MGKLFAVELQSSHCYAGQPVNPEIRDREFLGRLLSIGGCKGRRKGNSSLDGQTHLEGAGTMKLQAVV